MLLIKIIRDAANEQAGRRLCWREVTANMPGSSIFWRFNLTGSRQDLLEKAKFTAFQRLSEIEAAQKEPVRFEQAKTTLTVTA
jgi:hypothetical protein